MSDIVECIMDSAEHSEVDTAHILENCEALLKVLPHEQFVKVLRIVDEKDHLIHSAARENYLRGLRDGAKLARLLKVT